MNESLDNAVLEGDSHAARRMDPAALLNLALYGPERSLDTAGPALAEKLGQPALAALLLQYPDPNQRLRLRYLLAIAGDRGPKGLADLATNAGNPWLEPARWIATLLLYPVEAREDALVQALSSGTPEQRWRAAEALGKGSGPAGWQALRAASKHDALAVGSLGKISKRADRSIAELGRPPAPLPKAPTNPSAPPANPTSDVGWPEWILFGAFCLLICAAPLAAHLLLLSMPNASAWLDSKWLNGVYVSWAFLIYFSWSFLPSMSHSPHERLRAWLTFFALELAYPAFAWGLAAPDRLYLFADVASYFSTSLCLATGLILVWFGLGALRSGNQFGGVLLALVATLFCLLIPALAGEIAWWQQVELAGTGWFNPALRVVGVALGVSGVVRNLANSVLF